MRHQPNKCLSAQTQGITGAQWQTGTQIKDLEEGPLWVLSWGSLTLVAWGRNASKWVSAGATYRLPVGCCPEVGTYYELQRKSISGLHRTCYETFREETKGFKKGLDMGVWERNKCGKIEGWRDKKDWSCVNRSWLIRFSGCAVPLNNSMSSLNELNF